MTVEHTAGTAINDVSWQVNNGAGTIYCQKATSGATPTECCAPEGEHDVDCADASGGWSGYRLYLSGVEVCSGFTSGTAKSDTWYLEGNMFNLCFVSTVLRCNE